MEKFLFREEQRFRQWWMWLLTSSAFVLPLVIVGVELTNDATNEETNTLIVVLCVIVLVGVAVIWMLWNSCLSVKIVEEGILYRFYPIIRKWKRIDKNEIKAYRVRQYKPIQEYGGWGIKPARKGKDVAYNVKGNIGLQLILKNGKRILLGTQKKHAIKHAMNKMLTDVQLEEIDWNTQGGKTSIWKGSKARKMLIIFAIEIVLAILIYSLISIFN